MKQLVLMRGVPGAGKALDNNTIIPTPQGDKKISEIKEGDFLFDRKGNPTEVVGVFPQGKIKAYKVSLDDGSYFIVNDEHIIPYVTSRGNINSKTLKEIYKDYKKERYNSFGDGRTTLSYKYKVPKSEAVHYEEKELPLNPYALGVLIGDGGLTCKYLTVSSNEQDVVDMFMKSAGLSQYNKSKYNYNYTFQKQHNGNRPKEIQDIIKELGLNVKSIDRFIPINYLQGSIKQRKELLYGLIDTDGSISIKKTGSRKFSFSTNSNSLAKDVRQLALSLGYGVTLQEYHRKEETHKNVEYNVNIYTTENISKSNKHLQKLSTQTDWYESKKELYSKIIDIQEVEEREMTCFSVDNEEKLFLINDYIVTHNTTFIKEHGLENYALSPDTLRLQFGSPIYNEQGRLAITQDKDKQVWDTLFEILENRMQNGEFTVIDATHSTGKLIKKYETLARKYRYRTYVVTIEQDLDTLIDRNNQREELKKVPEEAIYNIYERLQHEHIPSYATEIDPNNLMDEIKWDKDFFDADNYDKIHVIGDVHSCFTAINQFASYQRIIDNPNELFIFVGDYFDRGLEPREMFEYLELIYKQPNVVLIEGNHEKHLRRYAFLDEEDYLSLDFTLNNLDDKNREFYDTAMRLFHARGFIPTLKEFMTYGITQKQVRRIVHSLQQMLYFNYRGQYYMINHGGILPNMLDDINLVSTHQIINGVGGYEYQIDEQWNGTDTIQIHGHRNLYREPLDVAKQSINLEGRVEKGGSLRAVTINGDNTLTSHEIENEVFDSKFLLNNDYTKDIDPNLTVEGYLKLAKEDPYIKVVPQYDNVVSVNFTKKAFNRKHWNQLSVTARGLFIDESTNTIIGRGYNKFFNINERPETKLENLPDTLQFPVFASLKYNGFLGLMFYDNNRDELIYASKSRTHLSQYDNDFALLFKEIVEETWTDKQIKYAKDYLKDTNRTLLFEVIDNINDPHIIYDRDKRSVVLLDTVDNTLKFNKLSNDALTFLAVEVLDVDRNISVPLYSFSNWNDLFTFYQDLEKDNSIAIEGFVFEDSNGFMLKYKTPYYNNWKYMRSLVESLSKGNLQRRPIQAILQKDKTLTDFYYWAKQQDKEYLEKDIITLRNDFYKETQD